MFEGMSVFHQVLWGIAIFGSVLFLIQFVMRLVGLGDDMDADGDDVAGGDGSHGDGDGDEGGGVWSSFYPFTFSNLTAFFTGFGWGALWGVSHGYSDLASALMGFAFGALLILIAGVLWLLFSKLRQSGTMNINNAVGAVGEVYLTIPQGRGKGGMVQVPVQGSLRDLSAMTDSGQPLPAGTRVEVVGVLGDSTLLVQPAN